jgi:hypothetical protein
MGLGHYKPACYVCLNGQNFNFMTFLEFATSVPYQVAILRGIYLRVEVQKTYDMESDVINVCDVQNQCHSVMT